MRTIGQITALTAALAGLTGCAIRQTVQPVGKLDEREVCLIANPSVKAGFFEAYRKSLVSKGYQVRQLPENASVVECAITSTYNAHWRWDLALYMAYAEIRVFSGGRQVGEAKYNSTRGGLNLGKFIDAEKKIHELVDQLFPGTEAAGGRSRRLEDSRRPSSDPRDPAATQANPQPPDLTRAQSGS